MSGSRNVDALDRAVTAIEAAELIIRRDEARKFRTYADLYTVAEREAVTGLGGAGLASRGVLEESVAYRSAIADVSVSLRLSEQTVRARVENGHELVTSYPATVDALEAGAIASQHCSVIAETGRVIGTPGIVDTPEIAERRARYEALVLAHASEVSPNQLRPYARRIAEQLAEEPLEERHACERARRRVWVEPADQGMSYLTAYIPAEDAQGIYSRLTEIAKHIEQAEAHTFGDLKAAATTTGKKGPPDTRRTRDEIRADALVDILSLDLTHPQTADELADAIEAGAATPAVRGIVHVIVHREHLADARDETRPANDSAPLPELEGYGPITVDTARKIAGRARHHVEVTVNSRTGDIEEITSRVPSAGQKQKLLVRDEHCRWPGCRTPGYRCDIDHTISVKDGGPTAMNNLGFLCRHHHTLKHHGGWKVRQIEHAGYEWVSPTGRRSRTRPESRVRFRATESPTEPPPGPFERPLEAVETSSARSIPSLRAEPWHASGCDPGQGEGFAHRPRAGTFTNAATHANPDSTDLDSATQFPF